MNIHAYLLCYNEKEIIQSSVEYYSEFCSRVFILNNMSTDGCIELVSNNPKVTVIDWAWPEKVIDESYYIHLKTNVYKDYSRKGGRYVDDVADWVICCDMDEILYHPHLLDVLKKYKNEKVTVPNVYGVDILSKYEIDSDRGLIDQYREGVTNELFAKRIIFDPNFNMSYSFGCHPKGVGHDYMTKTYGYKESKQSELTLLHFKNIGDRNYRVALSSSKRVNMDNMQLQEDGKYKGMASIYLNLSSGKVKSKNKTKLGCELFDASGFVKVNDSIYHANYFRDAAVYYEDSGSSKLAYTYMKVALSLRPNGPFIKEKIKSYEGRGLK